MIFQPPEFVFVQPCSQSPEEWKRTDSIWEEIPDVANHLRPIIQKAFLKEFKKQKKITEERKRHHHAGGKSIQSLQKLNLTIVIAFIDYEVLKCPLLDQKAFVTPKSSSEFFPFNNTTPVLCIGTEDLFRTRDQNKIKGYQKELRDRHRFWDSSIWHRYVARIVQYGIDLQEDAFTSPLKEVVADMIGYYFNGLYHSVVGREFVDYQRRKLAQSYYEASFEGHSEEVSPYYWHSETERKRQAGELEKKLQGFQWEAVLADDFVEKPLRAVEEIDQDQSCLKNKRELIAALINRKKPILTIYSPIGAISGKADPGDPKVKFEEQPVTVVTTYLQNHPHIDLILSDHYHGRDSDPDEKYGYQLMQRIKSEQKLTPHLGNYWVFPVSAFDEAFRSSLRVHGISQHSDFLHIDDGADPVNTPELFRYRMYGFLENYVETKGLGLRVFFEATIEVLTEILQEEFRENALREVLERYYPNIVQLNLKYSALLRAGTGPHPVAFAQKYLELFVSQEDDQAYEQLKDLVNGIQDLAHLLLHGTRLEWEKMWKICVFLEGLLENLLAGFEPSSSMIQAIATKGSQVLALLKQYIQQLRPTSAR